MFPRIANRAGCATGPKHFPPVGLLAISSTLVLISISSVENADVADRTYEYYITHDLGDVVLPLACILS